MTVKSTSKIIVYPTNKSMDLMEVEDCPEHENTFHNSTVKRLQKLKNENDLSTIINHDKKGNDCISDSKSKCKDSKIEKLSDTANGVKIPSCLKSLYKINPLDESSDFIECDLQKKLKNGNQKHESVLCEICKEDITLLNVQNREIHVNKCIDKQISSSSTDTTKTNETENVFILECPLCFKSFSTPELRSNHIKKCGKSKGLNTQSIIKALELQERHTLERISLGLPPKPIKVPKVPKNPAAKRTVTEPKNKSDSDFQLAKALSLSLASSSQSEDTERSENITMTVLKPSTANQRPGKKSKATLSNTPLLVLRSEEDRKRLLLQKVEAILTAGSKSEFDSSNQNANEISSDKQDDIQNKMPTLWKLACTAAEKSDYYVDLLFDWIKPLDHEAGDKLFHLSQIPGHEIVTQLPCDYTFSVPEEKNTCVLPSEESSPTDPCCSVTECLSSLVASSWMSDVDIHTACGTIIPAHKLLLALRCPPLKQDLQFCSEKGRATLKWGTISFDSALQFLNYIYTGSIKINDYSTSDLLSLANKYEVHGLIRMIYTNEKAVSEAGELNLNKNDITDNVICTNEKVVCETGQLNLNKNDVTDNVNLCHTVSSSPELQEAEEIDGENEDINTDLEIVYSCINSSLKPSQPINCKTADIMNISSEVSIVKENCNLYRTNNVCVKDIKISPKSDTSNFVSAIGNCSTSPVIFDCENVDSSSDDNEDIEFPVVTSPEAAKKSCPTSPIILKRGNVIKKLDDNKDIELPVHISSEAEESYSVAEELNMCTIESNDSNDSVEFLQSSYSSCKKLDQSISNNEDVTLPLQKLDSQSTILKDVPESDPKNNISRDSPKSGSKKLTTFSKVSSQNIFNICTKPESPSESYSKVSHSSFQYQNNSINETPEDFKETGLLNEDLNFSIERFLREETTPRKKNRISDSIESKKVSLEENLNSSPSEKLGSGSKQRLFVYSSPCKSITQVETKFCKNAEDTSVRNCNSPEILPYECDNGYRETESNVLGETSILYDCNNKCLKKEDFNFSAAVSPKTIMPDSLKALSVESSFNDPMINFLDFSTNESTSLSLKDDDTVKSGCSENGGSKKIAETVPMATPDIKHPQFNISHSPITPLPDFKSMMTPEIKAALKRIGVKALPRKKAVAVLSHVYNETHPMVNNEMDTNDLQVVSAIKTPEKSKVNDPKKRKKLTDDHQKQSKKRQKENHQEVIGESPESDDSKQDNPKWLECVPEISFSQSTQDSPTKSTTADIESVKEYILSNTELYDNILSYKPLNLIELHQELKNNNIKLSLQKLMDFLDEQCITFTCPRKEEYKKKQTARAQNFRKRMIAKLSQQTT